MPDDHRQAITTLFATWLETSRQEYRATLQTLMAVVFLCAGHPPMIGVEAFAKEFESVPTELELNIRDWLQKKIHIEGSVAYCGSFLFLEIN